MSIFSYVHGGQAVPVKVKRVFYRTGTAAEGYSVCYNVDALGVTAENEAVASGAVGFATALDGWCDARRLMVENPTYMNALHFAGVIARESDGVIGPNWITIHTPGSICKVYALVTGTGVESVNMNQMVTFAVLSGVGSTSKIGQFGKGGLPGAGSAMLLASGAAGLRMADLLDGPPSGGIEELAYATAQGDLSNLIVHGVVRTSAAASGTDGYTTYNWPSGRWAGQTLQVIVSTAVTSITSLIFEGSHRRVGLSTPTATTVVTAIVPACATLTAFSVGTEVVAVTGYYDGSIWAIAMGTVITT